MDRFLIRGGKKLRGTVRVSGAKNSALPVITASLLTSDPVEIENIPDVRDVATILRLLEHLGAQVQRDAEKGTCRIEVPEFLSHRAPYEMVKTMRASVLVLGPLVGREGSASVSLPGGCAIGARPVNFHIGALETLGVDVSVEHGYINASGSIRGGGEVVFPDRTVTGTENLMMASVLARGTTVLRNCAREPEITDLADFLRKMGAQIEGDGNDTIEIEGVETLHGARHRVISDRIETGTLLAAAAVAGEDVEIVGCDTEHLGAVIETMEALGITLRVLSKNAIYVKRAEEPSSMELSTSPYPGFPTDMQAQLMAVLTKSVGQSRVTETIFENRFMHVAELQRMGADIEIHGNTAVVNGPSPLTGTGVMATDLRASASLVIAGLIAEGETVIDRVYHLDRGYDRLETKLALLGADLRREPGPPFPQ